MNKLIKVIKTDFDRFNIVEHTMFNTRIIARHVIAKNLTFEKAIDFGKSMQENINLYQNMKGGV